MGPGLILVLQYIYQPHYEKKESIFKYHREPQVLHPYLCILTEKQQQRRNHSKKHPKRSWMVRRLKDLEDPQNTTFQALMNCLSRQKAYTTKPFFNTALIGPCYSPNAPIWSAASVNVFLTPFSSKGRIYSKILFPIDMGCMVCITPFAPFHKSRGWKTDCRRVLWRLISLVGLFHKHFYNTHHFFSVILCTTSLQLLRWKRQQLPKSYWKFKKVVLKHHFLLKSESLCLKN